MEGEGRTGASENAAGTEETAVRLRHDLGRYIRLSAPEVLEADTEALRARLGADVLATRSGAAGPLSAPAVFAAWMREGGSRLARREEFAGPVGRIEACLSEVGGLSKRLAALSREELERLDALTRAIAKDCRALAAAARGRR
jgi:hypothetical protein